MDDFKKLFSDESAVEVKGWWRKVCCIKGRLEDKIAIVTGANTGIGQAVTAELARRGCKVIMACRNVDKANFSKEQLIKQYGPKNKEGLISNIADTTMIPSLSPITEDLLVVEKLDLSSFQSIRDFVQRFTSKYEKLNFLVNNAGVMNQNYTETADGHELHLGVNYLGPFLLTELLIEPLKKGAPSRVIYVASSGHYLGKLHKPDLHLEGNDYGPYVAYNQSKLAGVMYTYELAKRLEGSNIITASVNPGFVTTEIQRNMTSWRDKLFNGVTKLQEVTPWQGCQTIMYTLMSNSIFSGGYYEDCESHMPDLAVKNDEERQWLWEKSCELVGLTSS